MKTESKYLTIFFLCLSICIAAQTSNTPIKADTIKKEMTLASPKWEGGFLVGATVYSGDLGIALAESRPIVGLFVRRELNDYFALNVSLYQGLIAGNDGYSTIDWRKTRSIQFKSSLTELSFRGDYHFLGNTKEVKGLSSGVSVFDDDHSKNATTSVRKRLRTISPFIYVGLGFMYNKPTTNFNNNPSPNPITEAPRITADETAIYSKQHVVIPMGGGLRIPLINKNAVLTLEGGFRPTFSDYIDGISIAGNPNKNDWYFVGDVALSKKLGYTKDSDKDGIADKYDLCPFLKGDLKNKGCPDRDGDGIMDDKDACPTVAGLAIYEGCPDSDGDGIIDKYDDCPKEAGIGKYKGCPTLEKQIAAKKDTSIHEPTKVIDLVQSLADTQDVFMKPIQIKNDNTKKDSLAFNDKPSKPFVAQDAPPQYVGDKTKPIAKDTNLVKIEKPIAPPQTQIDTPQYIGDKTQPIRTDTTVIKTDKPVAPISSPIDTPQYIGEKPIPSAKDTLMAKIDKPIAPIVNDTTIVKTDKQVVPVAPKIDAPQHVEDKPKPVSEDTAFVKMDKPVATTSEQTDTTQNKIEKPITAPISPSEIHPYLESASVVDTLSNAFNIVRNHYTIKPIYFETNKAIYKPESFVLLDVIARIMLENPKYKLRIKGFTDAVGTSKSNQVLSLNRAKSCYTYLLKKGVSAKRMTFKGFGQTQPAADNDTDEARQLNRRVEFEIITE